ncbi:PepSY domain-containing protein [Oceanobacillus chungangensis]|uniref:PepSY domain-containing protein n=1 Tax=Oceanobacillus chungangensis TaxID=1229152 RepID=A0A3D8PIK3_9BACI|nr:PepSY domain-containing protein [Oceanobacillus chungangensis]RDW15071.1 hypothetical protein CWR45_18820 [Oceanobacillus chungangensis]
MKKKIGVTIGAMAVAGLVGLGFSQNVVVNADPVITVNEIKEKVTTQYPGTITELELDEKSNKPIYEVEIKNDNREYELEIDGNTGEVLALDEKETKNDNIKTDEDRQTKSESKATDDDKDSVTQKTVEQKSTNKAVIGDKKARSIAANQFSGTIVELDLDEDDGRLIYEIEMENGDSDAEIEIDAYTGKILVVDIDHGDDD